MTGDEIASAVRYSPGGRFFRFIEELVLADFIQNITPVDKPVRSKLIRYRLKDEFLHFYYKFVQPSIRAIEDGSIKAYQLLAGQAFEQWRGYAFERLCLKHTHAIAKALEFSGIRYDAGAWFRSRKNEKTQVDLLFIRADNIISVCEMKYTNRFDSRIIDTFEQRTDIVSRYFKSGIQKVLICGKKTTLPSRVTGYFDAILFAEDIFF
ncbi:MAG: hypothetical protein GF350_05250 [Chitinivibrionales bacterium]|nr:hypothetical protein [Chitinivibrionales bacterium]